MKISLGTGTTKNAAQANRRQTLSLFTMMSMSESAGSPAQSGVGGGVVDPQEATPSQVGTPGSVLHLNKLCRHHLVRIQKVANKD